ncbi:MAG: hypothetical protein ACTSQQ_10700 [Candidatus Helarchaeota archaeon]
MIDKKKLILYLYKNLGLIALLTGIGFLLFGMLNIGILPPFYLSQSGSPGTDATFNLVFNGILWAALCIFILLAGFNFYSVRKDIEKIKIEPKAFDSMNFFLIAAIFTIAEITYFLILLLGVIKPIQFFPHFLFVADIQLMDLSIVFNAVTFFLIVSIIHRVSERFIKFGLKIGAIV